MRIAFTIGDVNGIGFEVLIKAITSHPEWCEEHHFSIVANKIVIKKLIEKYNDTLCVSLCKDMNFITINKNQAQKINIVEINNTNINHIAKQILNNEIEMKFGKISREAGIIAYHSIEKATELVLDKTFDAIITLPVSKAAIHISKKDFIGHTEMITEICGKKQSIMILFNKDLRIALATTHIPIYSVSRRITAKRLRDLIKNYNIVLRNDFGISSPKIAVLGLNPHASDNAMFGNEEKDVILPAIDVMKRKGINVEGAFPADGFFASKRYRNFDGVIAMYHDQGLIPLKMLADGGGVNFTACLPIVRTSPDHGTAFEIAGKDIANPQSTADAIEAAISIVMKRSNKNKGTN